MMITFETVRSDGGETAVYIQPSDPQLAQQKRDFSQERRDLLKCIGSLKGPIVRPLDTAPSES